MKISSKILSVFLFLSAVMHLMGLMHLSEHGASSHLSTNLNIQNPSHEVVALFANFGLISFVHGLIMAVAAIWAWKGKTEGIVLGIVYGIGIIAAGLLAISANVALSSNGMILGIGIILLALSLFAWFSRPVVKQ